MVKRYFFFFYLKILDNTSKGLNDKKYKNIMKISEEIYQEND